jgi:hypothetical protein
MFLLGSFERLISLVLSFLLLLNLIFSLLSPFLGFVESMGYVSLTRINRQDHPSLHYTKSLVVSTDCVVIQLFGVFFDVVNRLILLEIMRFGALEDIILHFLQQLIIPVILCLLPEQFLRFINADVFSFDLEQVEEALDEVLELDDLAVHKAVESLLVEVTLGK